MPLSARFFIIALAFISLPACSLLEISRENRETLEELFASRAACELTKIALERNLPHHALYQKAGSQCLAADPGRSSTAPYYADSTCNGDAFVYRKTEYDDFCKDLITPAHDRIGNAAVWAGETPAWTLNPPGRLALSILSIKSNHQPYMKRVRYKSVEVRDRHPLPVAEDGSSSPGEVVTLRGLGSCHLEMRIFKKNPGARNLKPLLAIHGGSWSYRGAGFAGFESELSHFTERGFVVFAPFYRLSDMVDGNYECNHASWQEITSDAEDALAWVKEHGADYGATNGKVYLMGGSAGGHLAAWLTAYKKEEVARTLLFYPPTDFQDYVAIAKASRETLKGEGKIGGFLGVDDIRALDGDNPSLIANTFTSIVAHDPASFPPVSMIHGVSDTLVPSMQSVRLCNAYNGDIENGPAQNDGGNPATGTYSKEYVCGAQGRLYLIAEADHALDFCVNHLPCAAGDEQSQQAVIDSMKKAIDWLAR